MTRTPLVILAALAVSGLTAWGLGGTLGLGVLTGCLCGASVAGLGVAWQRHIARTRPDKVFGAHVVAFVFKLAAVLCGALVFRFVDQAAARVDWRSFLVTFAAAVFVVMVVGAFDTMNTLRESAVGRERGTL
ncbi:MAG: hypothetical protein QF903_00230 [Planctomycetota bacterium]|jgi:hypothetical protein|nr:hypothetical protein [Planctomycetota bacterium]MDP6761405.1 hypothetical protein [Planctomycetota bacterium]MDP6987885.1 hypothetical protein [Planctomycetota bacterium]